MEQAWERAQDGDRGAALKLLSIANLKLLLAYFDLVQRYDNETMASMVGRLSSAMTVKGLLERAYLKKYVMAPESGPAGVVPALVRGLYRNRDGAMSKGEIRRAAHHQGCPSSRIYLDVWGALPRTRLVYVGIGQVDERGTRVVKHDKYAHQTSKTRLGKTPSN